MEGVFIKYIGGRVDGWSGGSVHKVYWGKGGYMDGRECS